MLRIKLQSLQLTPYLPTFLSLVLSVIALIIGVSSVNAASCIYARDMHDLRLNGRAINLDRPASFVLTQTKDPNVYRYNDFEPPYPMHHQIILTHSGAIVTNAYNLRDILVVFRIDFKSGISPLYITQDTTGNGTCDLVNLPLNRRDFVKITAIAAFQPNQ